MKPRYYLAAAGIVIAGIIAWRIYANTTSADMPAARMQAKSTMTVNAITASRRSVPLVFQANGRARARHSVIVRARVEGILQKVLFHEGERVKKGQLLFAIDKKPYKIKVAESKAQVEQDQAKLKSDQANAERMSSLVGNSYVSKQDYQNAKAKVQQDEATLAADKARLEQARMQLDYTEIHAPVSGKSGEITYKTGNLVGTGDSTELVTINQISPIEIQFNLPQSKLAALLRYRDASELHVSIASATGATVANNGKLVFIDNTVNKNTGTVSLKALFPNDERNIWPGELVTVSLRLTVVKNALVVPMVAVQPGQKGSYVYTVDKDGKVAVTPVDTGRHYQGLVIVKNGLETGDTVVVRIPRQLREGVKVKTKPMSLTEAVPKLADYR